MNEVPASHPLSRVVSFGLLVVLGIWSMANMVERHLSVSAAPNSPSGVLAE